MGSARRARVALLVAAVCLTGLATPGVAGQKRACMLVRDVAGDATDQPGLAVPGINQPDLDIVSADVASDPRAVTTVVRVQDLGTALDAAGRRTQYRFSFHLGAYGDVVTYAYRGVDGEKFHVTVPTEGEGTTKTLLPATGVFDVARSEVRVTIPLQQASGNRKIRRPTYISELAAATFRGVGPVAGVAGSIGVSTGVDTASSTSRYVVGSPSCVQVGR